MCVDEDELFVERLPPRIEDAKSVELDSVEVFEESNPLFPDTLDEDAASKIVE